MGSTLSVDWGYTQLHKVRWLAAVSCGFKGDFKAFSNMERTGKPKDTWVKWPDHYQLMHFSDCEGTFVPDYMLKDVVYKDTFMLGSYDKLKAEVTRLWEWVQKNRDKLVPNPDVSTWDLKAVEDLYHLVADENGYEVLLFH